LFIFAVTLITLLNVGAAPGYAEKQSTIKVLVSILPQLEWVQEIGKGKLEAVVLIPPGASPAVYEPSPKLLKKISESELFFSIGLLPFELSKMHALKGLNKRMIIVNTSEGVPLREMIEGHHDHHGDEHHDALNREEDYHVDPHIWLSPANVEIQLETMVKALVKVDPENAVFYKQNLAAYVQRIRMLDQYVEEMLADKKGRELMVFHPFLGYFADRYGFRQVPIEVAGKSPTMAQLKGILTLAKKKRIKSILVQKQFGTSMAKVIADAMGGTVVEVDPLSPMYIKSIKTIARKLADSL